MIAKTHKKIIKIICIVLACVLALVGMVFAFIKIGEIRLRESLSFTDSELTDQNAYGEDYDVIHNGKGYNYNENLINILCIGVDKHNKQSKNDSQADAIYLLSLDTDANKLNALAISRNTLADIDIYDMNDEFLSTDRAQICFSYVYGKDDEHSSYLTSKAVSRLLYDIPINSYYTIFTDAIDELVNSVGGVKVKIPEDMGDVSSKWKKGATVTLNSEDALRFIQFRKESNAPRIERQKIFINSFISSAKSAFAKDITLPLDLYRTLAKNSVTNIDIAQVSYLATEMANAEYKMHSISGKNGSDGNYETFQIDEEKLYEQVLNLFYIKTK